MTRATNFGIKRTYLQAGFDNSQNDHDAQKPSTSLQTLATEVSKVGVTEINGNKDASAPESGAEAPRPKKKRKRTPKSKRDGYAAERAAEAAKLDREAVPTSEADDGEKGGDIREEDINKPGEPRPYESLSKNGKKKRREKDRKAKIVKMKEMKAKQSERLLPRRLKKNDKTVCFACREKGHAAADCPTTKESTDGDKGKVGICYRCGSTQHTLSKCKKPANDEDPFPYASCFVCNGKGHLASACPHNKAKGIYPNGGSCKLCGEITHLAKDCKIKEKVTEDAKAIFGTGNEAGADEDDFHTFKRKTTRIERDERKETKLKEVLEVKTGLHSGVIKAYGNVAPLKKVVVFK